MRMRLCRKGNAMKLAWKKQTTHPGAIATVTLLALLCVAALLLSRTVFVVHRITVEGRRLLTDEEIISAAGLSYGQSMFSVDASEVEKRVNEHRYLDFVSLWRDFPDRLILTVEENTPYATMLWMGTLIMLDKEGIVLEQMVDIDIALNVPVITGAQVASVRVGQPIAFSTAGQEDAVRALLFHAEEQGLLSDIAELNVADLDNLYLVTYDGLQVLLGSETDLQKKIAALDAVLPQLRSGYTVRGGVLDVTTGTTADFKAPVLEIP